MKMIDNLQEFIEKFDATKKTNPLDLSSDQDLSIAIMNLISIEEHLAFSGAKTGDTAFYDLINTIREDRKELLGKIIKSYKGEVWCISKHLLATCMRTMEVGTKAIGSGQKAEAYKMFDKAYSFYCLFWALNMNMISAGEAKEALKDQQKATETASEESKVTAVIAPESLPSNSEPSKTDEKESFTKRLKNFITDKVNCCRE